MKNVQIKLTKTISEGGKNVRKETGVVLDVPVYSYEELEAYSEEAKTFAEDAIEAACLAKARNAGEQSKVHSSIEELIAKAERGEALKVHAEFCKSFAEHLAIAAAEKKQAVRDVLVGMARNKNVLATSNETRRAALAGYLQHYVENTTEANVAAYGSIVEGLVNACNGEVIDDADFE